MLLGVRGSTSLRDFWPAKLRYVSSGGTQHISSPVMALARGHLTYWYIATVSTALRTVLCARKVWSKEKQV
jgi:hypothetical protein